jgi:uncharacterized membrane protein YedE/YeeE
MIIDWMHFTPWAALTGGVIIGVAAAMFAAFNGRIAGVSGIVAGLLRPSAHDWRWRAAFVGGLVIAPVAYGLFRVMPDPVIDAGYPVLVVAGLLVGFGSRLGSGCTSGHAVCGLARLSRRSLAATLTFMSAGFLTVYVVRHLGG